MGNLQINESKVIARYLARVSSMGNVQGTFSDMLIKAIKSVCAFLTGELYQNRNDWPGDQDMTNSAIV